MNRTFKKRLESFWFLRDKFAAYTHGIEDQHNELLSICNDADEEIGILRETINVLQKYIKLLEKDKDN